MSGGVLSVGQGAAEPGVVLARDFAANFYPNSLQHAAAVCASAVLIALFVAEGLRRLRNDPTGRSERAFGRGVGWYILIYQACETLWWLLPVNRSIEKSLPLALCDLAAWASAITLLLGYRRVRTLLYFWGLCLSSQAFLTPILTQGEGCATPRFWLFFIGHSNIVGVAIYDLVVRRYRPSWGDCGFAVLATMGYVALVVPLNIAVGANYGFVGPTDDQPGVVALLGPWPWRVHGVMAGGMLLFVLATLPWRLFGARDRRP